MKDPEKQRRGRNSKLKGKRREDDTRKYFRQKGWGAWLTAPKEPFDLIISNDFEVWAIEVKATKTKPCPYQLLPIAKEYVGKFTGKKVVWWAPRAREPEIWELDVK